MNLHLVYRTFFFIILLQSAHIYAQWAPLNTGINDNLNAVIIDDNQNTIIVAGEKGVYYTHTGGANPSHWTRWSATWNPTLQNLYDRTVFRGLKVVNAFSYRFYAYGKDTVNNIPVVLYIDVLNGNGLGEIIYEGTVNSGINKLVGENDGSFYAVGENNLLVHYSGTTTNTITEYSIYNSSNINFTDIIKRDGTVNSKYSIVSDTITIKGSMANILSSNPGVVHPLPASAGVRKITNDYPFNTDMDIYYGNSIQEICIDPNTNLICGEDAFTHYYPDTLVFNDFDKYFATSNGVYSYLSNSNNLYCLEWHPSSGTGNFNDISSSLSFSPTAYAACGDSGKVYVLTGSNEPQPYLFVDLDGACVNDTTEIRGIYGTSNTWKWFIDGVQVSTSNSFDYIFNSTGPHTIKLIGNNPPYTDTITKVIDVSGPPYTGISISGDTVLCQSGIVEVELDTTEMLAEYSFFNITKGATNSNWFPGNDSVLTIFSDSIFESSNIVVQTAVQSTNQGCLSFISDTIFVEVEKTKADFHINMINTFENEQFQVFEQSIDASTYLWSFPTDAAFLTSNQDTVINSYSNSGNHQIQLIASSVNGCSDTIVKSGPFTLNSAATTLNCWDNYHASNYAPGVSNNYKSVEDFYPLSNGDYLVAGKIEKNFLESQFGLSLDLDSIGGYLAKYNKDGILKWVVRTYILNQFYEDASFLKVIETDDKSIYVSGITTGIMIDNSGDTVVLDLIPGPINKFVAKFDSLGKYQWHINTAPFEVDQIAEDDNGDILLSLRKYDNSTLCTFEHSNGTIDTLSNIQEDHGLAKIDEDGSLIWHTAIQMSYTGEEGINKICFDQNDNILISGDWGSFTVFESADNSHSDTLINPYSQLGGSGFIAKYDANGVLIWTSKAICKRAGYSEDFEFMDMEVDQFGSTYLCGKVNTILPVTFEYYKNNDSAEVFDMGLSIVTKVSSTGEMEWVRSNSRLDYADVPQIELYNNELSVAFRSQFNTDSIALDTIKGEPGQFLVYNGNGSSFRIVVYDTSGSLIKSIYDTTSYNSGHKVVTSMKRTSESNYKFGVSNTFDNSNCTFFGLPLVDSISKQSYVVNLDTSCMQFVNLPNLFHFDTVHVSCGDSFTSPSGNIYSGISNSFLDTAFFSSAQVGIDSLVYTYVEMLDSNYIGQEYTDTCAFSNYVFPDGTIGYNISSDTVYTSHFSGILYCDSAIVTHLTVNYLNPIIGFNGTNFTCAVNNAIYQWLDCDNGLAPILGETGQFFTPLSSGNYACAIQLGNCIDTSDCVFTNSLSLIEEIASDLNIYPNPFNDEIKVDVGKEFGPYNLKVIGTDGRLIYSRYIVKSLTALKFNLSKGVYMFELNNGRERLIKRIVKN